MFEQFDLMYNYDPNGTGVFTSIGPFQIQFLELETANDPFRAVITRDVAPEEFIHIGHYILCASRLKPHRQVDKDGITWYLMLYEMCPLGPSDLTTRETRGTKRLRY